MVILLILLKILRKDTLLTYLPKIVQNIHIARPLVEWSLAAACILHFAIFYSIGKPSVGRHLIRLRSQLGADLNWDQIFG